MKDVDINNLDKSKILEVKKNVYPKIIKKYEKADYELFSDICDRFFKPKYTFNDKLSFKMEQIVSEIGMKKFKIDEIYTEVIDVPEEKKV